MSHRLHYLCKQQGIYALEIVRQCLEFVLSTLDYTACQNKDLKHNLKILHQFNSNIRAHLMSLDENIEAFDSLKKLERIFIKKNIEESQSKQTDISCESTDT